VKAGTKSVSIYTKSKDLVYYVGNSISAGYSAGSNTKKYDLEVVVDSGTTASSDYVGLESSETTVALWNPSYDVNGGFVFLKEGTATIKAYSKLDKTVKDEIKVTVKNKDKPISSVTFSPAELDYAKMAVGGQIDLTKFLSVKPSGSDGYVGYAKRVWTSSDETIAKVSTAGKVYLPGTGKNGKVTITLTETDKLNNTKSGSVVINVETQVSKLESVELNKKAATIYYLNKDENAGTYLKATTRQISETSSALTWTWSTSDATVAIIDQTYVSGEYEASVVPTGVGKCTITATVTDGTSTVSASCEITVDGKGTGPAVKVTDAKGKKSSTVYLKKGEDSILTLTAEPAATEWVSENENIATVKDGVVTIVGKGKVHITVKTADGNVGIYGINAKAKAAKITIKNKEVKVNKTKKLYAIDKNAYDTTAKVTVAKPEILQVNADGTMKGLKKGSTKVTIETADYIKTVTVKVKK
jgi:flagellar basal body rod protein FlgF